MPLPKEKFKVFISHATAEDGELVNWMAEALDRLHLRAFVYERYPMGGQNRFDVIKHEIRACPYFLVVLTKAGIASQWVNQEIGYAVGVGRTLIPVVEIDSYAGSRTESKGFVELHDQISYDRNDNVGMMALVVYTFYARLADVGRWKDTIFLSCNCGYDFDAQLDFVARWEEWQQKQNGQPLNIEWRCPNCRRAVEVSFPDFHLLHQEG